MYAVLEWLIPLASGFEKEGGTAEYHVRESKSSALCLVFYAIYQILRGEHASQVYIHPVPDMPFA